MSKKYKLNYQYVSVSDVLSKWVGESEKMVKQLFTDAIKNPPTLIFLDEVDGFCPKRKDEQAEHVQTLVTEFLVQIDNASKFNSCLIIFCLT